MSPPKALQYNQLAFKTAGSAVPSSGHEVFKVEFQDSEGEKKSGFYKPLDATYPAFLAMTAVAYSVKMSMALGEKVAEDRLVLNEKGEILGTVSIALPNFKPMICTWETLPADNQEKELVNPSVATMLKYNVAETLVAEYISQNDDPHPGNYSLFGIIDHDMRDYKRSSIVKGPRVADAVKEAPEIAFTLRSGDIDNFPNNIRRTHWPAHLFPGNLNFAKGFMAYASFQNLAKNPALQMNGEVISFQDQLFHAFLKEAITYDPDVLRARLAEYLGDIPLNYMSLEQAKTEQLSASYPDLFNSETNKQPFVDYIMQVFQQQYDEFYRATVFYQGCEKNAFDVPVVSYNQYLQNRPSAYEKIRTWVEEQNQKMEVSWQKFQLAEDQDHIVDIQPTLSKYCVPPDARLSSLALEKRYHQIWRDAHVCIIQEILFSAQLLSTELLNELKIKPQPLELPNKPMVKVDDESLTAAWQLIDNQFAEMELATSMDCAYNSSLREGVIVLNKFIKELRDCSQAYYHIPREQLKVDDNLAYCNATSRLIQDYETTIYQKLGTSSIWAKQFSKVVQDLQQYYGRLNFQRHLLAADIPLDVKVKHDYSALLQRQHTDKEIVSIALDTLFNWAAKVDKVVLEGAVELALKEYNRSVSSYLRTNRVTEVSKYLKGCIGERGDNKLAYILSSGGQDKNSLNTILIKHLIPIVLRDAMGVVDVNLMSLTQACERGMLDLSVYTKSAAEYAQKNERFTHIYSEYSVDRFNATMYRWANSLSRGAFQKLVEDVLDNEYAGYSFNLFSNKRRVPEVKGYFKPEKTNAQILALIFSKGDFTSTSLNPKLFKRVVENMRTTISMSVSARQDSDYQWIMDINIERNPAYYQHFMDSLQEKCKPYTFNQILRIEEKKDPIKPPEPLEELTFTM